MNVNVQLGKTYSEVEVFDPLVGATPIQTLTQISSVQPGITDHPLIVEIEPAPIVTAQSAGASGAATIGAGTTLELTAADSATVTFQASTGMLKLDNPSTFVGEIFNFTGNGSLSGSDQIDLRTINYNSVHDSYGTGVLTVTDGTNIANLHFSGSYTLANFKFASDGSGGTIVYDPPVLNSPTAGTRIVTADHSNDAFLFHTNLAKLPAPNTRSGPTQPPLIRLNSHWPQWRSSMTHMRIQSSPTPSMTCIITRSPNSTILAFSSKHCARQTRRPGRSQAGYSAQCDALVPQAWREHCGCMCLKRELVLRLASLLWRLRRATTMETGLFDIQADHLKGLGSYNGGSPTP